MQQTFLGGSCVEGRPEEIVAQPQAQSEPRRRAEGILGETIGLRIPVAAIVRHCAKARRLAIVRGHQLEWRILREGHQVRE